MGNLKNSNYPKLPIILGYAGLTPFIFAALSVILNFNFIIDPLLLLLNYGSVILSFIGAVSWGFVTKESSHKIIYKKYIFLWSVFPSLIAFLALLSSSSIGLGILIFGFILAYLVELRTRVICKIPEWYLYMRIRLTVIVTFCLCVGLASSLNSVF